MNIATRVALEAGLSKEPEGEMSAGGSEAAAIRPLVAGNWKMNGLQAGLAEAALVRASLDAKRVPEGVDVMICPPATLIAALARMAEGSPLGVGAQDCHWHASGAHTGDISAEMLRDAGAAAVIVGHSERRADHGELDSTVMAKARAAHRAGLAAIVCVGESEGQRRAGLTLDVVIRQLAGSLPDEFTEADTIIAYEPVWAIGTGLTPTRADIGEVHGRIRACLLARLGARGRLVRILYGGSVKPSNAGEIAGIADVNGALVGGASLKAADLLAIAAAYGR